MSQVFSPEEFADWLTRAFTESPYKSWRAVAIKVDTAHSTLSRLAGAKPQTMTNKPSQPNADLVIRLATLFGKNVNEALMKGGHAPLTSEEDEGLYDGFDELSPDMQKLARQQIRSIIDSLVAADKARKN